MQPDVATLPITVARPLVLLTLAVPIAIIVVARRWPPPLRRRAARVSLALRLLIVLCLALAAAGLQIQLHPTARTVIVVADRSDSVHGSDRVQRDVIAALVAGLSPNDRLGVVSVGRSAVVETVPSTTPAFTTFATDVNTHFTDLQSGIRLANAVMPDDTGHQMVIMTDGRQNIGNAREEIQRAHDAGIRADIIAVGDQTGPEVLVDSVSVPAAVPPGAKVHVRVILRSTTATIGTLHVISDGGAVNDLPVSINAGETDVELDVGPFAPGMHSVDVTVDAAADTLVENNMGRALVQVLGTQRVLIVEGHPGAGINVVQALQSASVSTVVVAPDAVGDAATNIAAYQSVVLADVPAAALGPDRMAAIQAATRDLGVGLVTIGGPHTYGPGGWLGTPLEAVSPISMQIKNDPAKPPVAVVLVLESVESETGDATVRGAAAGLLSQLTPNDLIGVTDGATGMVVPLQTVGDGSAARNTLTTQASFGDPGDYDTFLQTAGTALAAHPNTNKHIILLGDGDVQPVSRTLIKQLNASGITISVVGVDIDKNPAQMAEMKAIATAGGGRFYQSESPAQVPDILLKETNEQLRPWIVQQTFLPTLAAPSPILNGLDVNHFPALDGYVAATAKPAAAVVLRGPSADPVLAEWQYGLGRVVSWTSDAEGRWTQGLLRSPQGGQLLANLVGGTLPLQSDPALAVSAQLNGDTAHITVTLGRPITGAQVSAAVSGPQNSSTTVLLASTQPGRFEGDFPADKIGDYVMRVTVGEGGQTTHAVNAGLTIAYSPEYRFLGVDKQFLAELAKAGGGSVLATAADVFKQPIPDATVSLALGIYLLMLATVLFPFDVALRRLTLRSGDRAEWAEVRRRRRADGAAPAAEEATLGRLRERVTGVREDVSRRAEPPPGIDSSASGASAVVKREGNTQPVGEESVDLATRLMEKRRRQK